MIDTVGIETLNTNYLGGYDLRVIHESILIVVCFCACE